MFCGSLHLLTGLPCRNAPNILSAYSYFYQVSHMLNKKNQDLFLRRKRAFVEAASKLIQSEPFSSISIRKIAEEAGFHNSTIYSYFQDSDWLLSLASVRYLQPYSDDLMEINHKELTSYDRFYEIWNCFCRHAFSSPELFYNFFFGKYKFQLTELLEEYYALFPNNKNEHSPVIQSMFLGNTIYDRCLSILEPLIDDPKTRVTQDTLQMANFIIASTLEEFLSVQVQNCRSSACVPSDEGGAGDSMSALPPEDYRKPTAEFLNMLHFIIDC